MCKIFSQSTFVIIGNCISENTKTPKASPGIIRKKRGPKGKRLKLDDFKSNDDNIDDMLDNITDDNITGDKKKKRTCKNDHLSNLKWIYKQEPTRLDEDWQRKIIANKFRKLLDYTNKR